MRRPALVVLLLAALCSALQASERSADPQLLRPGSSLTNEQRLDWAVGRSFTHKPWVSAPATTTARDGLGPWFNANSCLACHPGNGQGQLPENGPGLVLRLPIDSPLGSQLQDRALPGFSAEGRIHWQETLNGALRARRYTVIDQPTLAVSARLAPELRGVAALDQVRDADIVAWADPDDLNGDGISGRPALLPANEESGKRDSLAVLAGRRRSQVWPNRSLRPLHKIWASIPLCATVAAATIRRCRPSSSSVANVHRAPRRERTWKSVRNFSMLYCSTSGV